MICVPDFGKPCETPDKLLAAGAQAKCDYRSVIEMKLRFTELNIRLVRARCAVSVHRHDMNART